MTERSLVCLSVTLPRDGDDAAHSGNGSRRRGQGVRQTLRTDIDPVELLWAAGLFAGEGTAGVRSQYGRKYPTLAVKMLDGAAIRRFADTFGLRTSRNPYVRGGWVYRTTAGGSVATEVLERLLPHLMQTEKGAQVSSVLYPCREWTTLVPQTRRGTSRSTLERFPGRGGVREALDRSRFKGGELVWASGLFAGEGYAGVQQRTSRGRTYRYPTLSLSMYDAGSVLRFGMALGTFMYWFASYDDPKKTCFRVCFHGSRAEVALRAMYPHRLGTAKGVQVERLFRELGMSLCPDGSGETWKRSNGLTGRAMSPEHKRNISVAQRARWKRLRSGI